MKKLIAFFTRPDHVRLLAVGAALSAAVIVAAWFAYEEFWWWLGFFPFLALGRYQIFLREEADRASRKR